MATARRKTPKPAAKRAAQPKARPDPDVVVVSGPPGQLRATVSVENTADQRVAVRGAILHREGEQETAGAVAALVPAGGVASVPISFAIGAATAPGEYPAEVEVGGARRPAVLHVQSVLSMHVSPRRALVAPGRQDVELLVTNDGNVEVTVAAVARARTRDDGRDPGPDVTLALDAPVTVSPASSLTLTAHIEVPDELDPARRHTATIPVGLADLDVIILPRTPSESPS